MRAVYQVPPIEVARVGAPLLLHIVTSVWRVVRRRRLGQPQSRAVRTRLQRYSAVVLLVFIVGHVVATRGASLVYEVWPGFDAIAFTMLWVPAYFIPYYALFAVAALYHLIHGLTVALPRLGVRRMGRLRDGRVVMGLAVVGGVLLLLGVAGFAGAFDDELHRSIVTRFAGTIASRAPSTGPQLALDLRPDGRAVFGDEPSAFVLSAWDGRRLGSHLVHGARGGIFGRMQRLAPRLSAFLCVLVLASSPACAGHYKLDAEGPTYAAQAKISVKVNKTGVRSFRVVMIHLAPPARIDPANKGYMVWIAVPGQATVKAGFLSYSERRRRGVLSATTPHAKFEVIVTIETDPSATVPGPKVILRKIVARS